MTNKKESKREFERLLGQLDPSSKISIEKKIENLEDELDEYKNIAINTSKEQTKSLIKWFEDLKKDFWMEERRWLMISFMVFISILFLVIIPIIDIFAYKYIYKIIFWWIPFILLLIVWVSSGIWIVSMLDDETQEEKNKESFYIFLWKNFKKRWFIYICILVVYWFLIKFTWTIEIPDKPIFNIDTQYILFPLWFLFFTFLYFSIYQYSKAKEMRIENQNKIALLYGFQALKSEVEWWYNNQRFYNNIADVVFTKVYNWKWKHDNFPVDKIIDIVNFVNKK